MNDTTIAIVIIAIGIIALVALGWYLWARSRSRELRTRFGPEYDRTVSEAGRTEGEKSLMDRRKRVERYDLRPLSAQQRVVFLRRWEEVQARFVDDPQGSISAAQDLVDDVLRERGYPVGDERRTEEDVSVESAVVVDHYRQAREIARRSRDGEASTEDLRIGFQHYREMFENLLEGGAPVAAESRAPAR